MRRTPWLRHWAGMARVQRQVPSTPGVMPTRLDDEDDAFGDYLLDSSDSSFDMDAGVEPLNDHAPPPGSKASGGAKVAGSPRVDRASASAASEEEGDESEGAETPWQAAMFWAGGAAFSVFIAFFLGYMGGNPDGVHVTRRGRSIAKLEALILDTVGQTGVYIICGLGFVVCVGMLVYSIRKRGLSKG